MKAVASLTVYVLATIVTYCNGDGDHLSVDRFNGPLFNKTCATIHAKGYPAYSPSKYEHFIVFQGSPWGPPTKLASFKVGAHRLPQTNRHSNIITTVNAETKSTGSSLDVGIRRLASCLFGSFSFMESDEGDPASLGNRKFTSSPPVFDAINFSRPDVLFALNIYINQSLSNAISRLETVIDTIQTKQHLFKRTRLLLSKIVPGDCSKGRHGFGTYTIMKVYRSNGWRDILCDTHTDMGGWIVIQRRTNGFEDFNADWQRYKRGFGSLNDDFWVGNDWLVETTNQESHRFSWELRVDATFNGVKRYFVNWPFRVDTERQNYRLKLGRENYGDDDPLTTRTESPAYLIHNMKFSTRDRDNDLHPSFHCARHYGGWWFNRCAALNPNAIWGAKRYGVVWRKFSGWFDSMDTIELKIRRRDVPTPSQYL